MKQKLNYFLSLFCVLLLFSCSEEKDYIEKSSSGSLKKISFEEFQRNSKAMRTFNVIETKTRMAKSSQRIIFDSINNFSIDTDKIIIAEKDGKICYTILIERPYATSKTENLVLEEAEDGFYIPFIFSYDLDNIDKEKAQNHELISDLFSKLLVTKPEDLNLEDFLEIANRTTICITVQVAYCTTGNHNSSNLNGDENGNYACTAVGYREQTMCYSDGGGGGSTAGGNTGTGYTSYGGGTNDGGAGAYTSNPTQTAPPPPNNNTANQNQIITLPLVDLEEEGELTPPCAELNAKSNETEFIDNLYSLKLNNTLNLKFEKGFIETRNVTNIQTPVFIPKTGNLEHRTLNIDPSDNATGFIHTHNNDYYIPGIEEKQLTAKIFSSTDIMTFINLASTTTQLNMPLGDTYGMMVSSAGTYSLKFLNSNVPNLTPQQRRDLHYGYLEIVKLYKSEFPPAQSNVVLAFLKLLKLNNLSDNVGLYEASFPKATSNNPKPKPNWSQLKITTDSTNFTKIPCLN
jgi:hypothetical protein